ncbi:hypothetical protein ACSQ67_004599 [Phaseolus vulgaris]
MVEKKTTRVEHVRVLRCTPKLSHTSHQLPVLSLLFVRLGFAHRAFVVIIHLIADSDTMFCFAANILYFEALGALDRRNMVNIFDLGG